jgi:hypothetical protein
MKAVTVFILLCLLATYSFAQDSAPLSLIEGTWRITRVHYCPHICALSNEEADAFEGRTITYSASAVTSGSGTCTSPTFTIQVWDPDKFESFYRFDPTEIGLKNGDPVLEIDIQCANSDGIELGENLIVKDSDTLLMWLDGVHFEAKRVAGIS